MRHDVIPPLSDCIQLSVEQYRSKLYDIIRAEKLVRRQKQEVADECIDYFVESLEKWREEMKGRVNVITVAEFRSHPLNPPAVADDER